MLSNKNFIIQLKSFTAVPPYAFLMLFKVRWMVLSTVYWTVFFPDRSIAALPHFFRKCCTIISPWGPKGAKKKKLLENVR